MGSVTKKPRLSPVDLPGANLGLGAPWPVLRSNGSDEEPSNMEELVIIRKTLKKMLSKPEHADVEFYFHNSDVVLSAHREVLCARSEGFRSMFRHDCKEKRSGRIMATPGTTAASFSCFLEFLYLGKPYKKCASADGRELWVLSEIYTVPSLRSYLLSHIDQYSVCAAYEFALVPEGIEREPMIKRCEEWVMQKGLKEIGRTTLSTVGFKAMKGLACVLLHKRKSSDLLPWRYMLGVFR
jgi:hypothetical protein